MPLSLLDLVLASGPCPIERYVIRGSDLADNINGPFADQGDMSHARARCSGRMSQLDLVTSAEFIQFAPQHRLNLRSLPLAEHYWLGDSSGMA